uniref:Helicase C-terminal domain-containing protein n=1 Tax=Chromera velia CCMP2878 TaxID=1169474 RepID=A0A0G4I8I6_9ALVE|eukprot:Cvel_11970.t1-p1 / transcript=Cvel_11970.t1 / gene=Cvel_11970 / organism=Chromera_velia_CCMP2878 / gene_product=DNA polymerase theta, putative / transcript_product=DNA polymerase theta, putative / location=Cvel_scaffold767:24144-38265(-) / protein_length=1553 / sequence_SO=supercontig / SO=protein_coding / is_pseudo=false
MFRWVASASGDPQLAYVCLAGQVLPRNSGFRALKRDKEYLRRFGVKGGKSLVAEILLARRALFQGKRGIVVLPLVALCEERVASLQKCWGSESAGLKIQPCHSGKGTWNSSVDVAVCTIEKALPVLNRGFLLEILILKILYLRELQRKKEAAARAAEEEEEREREREGEGGAEEDEENVRDRGPTKRRKLREKEKDRRENRERERRRKEDFAPFDCRIIAFSATLPNAQELSDWMGGVSFQSAESERPVPLDFYLKVSGSPNVFALNSKGGSEESEFSSSPFSTASGSPSFPFSPSASAVDTGSGGTAGASVINGKATAKSSSPSVNMNAKEKEKEKALFEGFRVVKQMGVAEGEVLGTLVAEGIGIHPDRQAELDVEVKGGEGGHSGRLGGRAEEASNGQVLIFCSSRAKTEITAKEVARFLSKLRGASPSPPKRHSLSEALTSTVVHDEDDELDFPFFGAELDSRGSLLERRRLLVELEVAAEGYGGGEGQEGGAWKALEVFKECVPLGVGFHHAGLGVTEKRAIERGFRKGTLRVLCATSTVAVGVNLPASRVIFSPPLKVGTAPLDPRRFSQMAGRAGRLGFHDRGEVFVLAAASEINLAKKLLKGGDAGVSSQLHGQNLARAVIEILSLPEVQTVEDVTRVLHEFSLRCRQISTQEEREKFVEELQTVFRYLISGRIVTVTGTHPCSPLSAAQPGQTVKSRGHPTVPEPTITPTGPVAVKGTNKDPGQASHEGPGYAAASSEEFAEKENTNGSNGVETEVQIKKESESKERGGAGSSGSVEKGKREEKAPADSSSSPPQALPPRKIPPACRLQLSDLGVALVDSSFSIPEGLETSVELSRALCQGLCLSTSLHPLFLAVPADPPLNQLDWRKILQVVRRGAGNSEVREFMQGLGLSPEWFVQAAQEPPSFTPAWRMYDDVLHGRRPCPGTVRERAALRHRRFAFAWALFLLAETDKQRREGEMQHHQQAHPGERRARRDAMGKVARAYGTSVGELQELQKQTMMRCGMLRNFTLKMGWTGISEVFRLFAERGDVRLTSVRSYSGGRGRGPPETETSGGGVQRGRGVMADPESCEEELERQKRVGEVLQIEDLREHPDKCAELLERGLDSLEGIVGADEEDLVEVFLDPLPEHVTLDTLRGRGGLGEVRGAKGEGGREREKGELAAIREVGERAVQGGDAHKGSAMTASVGLLAEAEEGNWEQKREGGEVERDGQRERERRDEEEMEQLEWRRDVARAKAHAVRDKAASLLIEKRETALEQLRETARASLSVSLERGRRETRESNRREGGSSRHDRYGEGTAASFPFVEAEEKRGNGEKAGGTEAPARTARGVTRSSNPLHAVVVSADGTQAGRARPADSVMMKRKRPSLVQGGQRNGKVQREREESDEDSDLDLVEVTDVGGGSPGGTLTGVPVSSFASGDAVHILSKGVYPKGFKEMESTQEKKGMVLGAVAGGVEGPPGFVQAQGSASPSVSAFGAGGAGKPGTLFEGSGIDSDDAEWLEEEFLREVGMSDLEDALLDSSASGPEEDSGEGDANLSSDDDFTELTF